MKQTTAILAHEQEGTLEDALARQKRAEQAASLAQEQLEQERSAAAAARERSKNAAAGGLADREEKAAIKAQLAGLQAEVTSLHAAAKVSSFYDNTLDTCWEPPEAHWS
jgi:hypothetical protein